MEHDAQWFLDQLMTMKQNTQYRALCTVHGLVPYGVEHPIITTKLVAFRAAWTLTTPEFKDEVRTRLVMERGYVETGKL